MRIKRMRIQLLNAQCVAQSVRRHTQAVNAQITALAESSTRAGYNRPARRNASSAADCGKLSGIGAGGSESGSMTTHRQQWRHSMYPTNCPGDGPIGIGRIWPFAVVMRTSKVLT